MGVRLGLACVLAFVCGCYEPTFERCAVRCTLSDSCPSGLSCSGGFCLEPGESATDCPAADPDAGNSVDGPTADAVPVGTMVAFPAGSFTMGCRDIDIGCMTDEQPAHTVTLSAFEIDATEVRQSEYLDCLLAGDCAEPGDDPTIAGPEWDPDNKPNHPVYHVTWVMADDYCRFAGKRLPTEAEWERAARGTTGRTYPWGEETPECFRAHHLDCIAEVAPVPVGSSNAGATPEGVFDMSGNVFEWVNDWYTADYYSMSDGLTDPPGPPMPVVVDDQDKVGRGGGYRTSGDLNLRGALRTGFKFDNDPNTYGFRCARSL